MSNGAYPITAGMVFEAIQAGAREATLQMLKDVDFSTAEGQAAIVGAINALAGSVATDQGQSDMAQAIAALASVVATNDGQGAIAGAIDTLAQAAAKENTLADVLQALQGTLGVSGNVGITGGVDVSNRPDRELGKVTLTGQIVVRQVVHERAVRTSSASDIYVQAPERAIGFFSWFRIYGMTGDFSTASGVRGFVDVFGEGLRWITFDNANEHRKSPGVQINCVNAGYDSNNARHAYGGNFFQVGSATLPYLGSGVACRLQISGDFEPGQGVDCEMVVFWIMEV